MLLYSPTNKAIVVKVCATVQGKHFRRKNTQNCERKKGGYKYRGSIQNRFNKDSCLVVLFKLGLLGIMKLSKSYLSLLRSDSLSPSLPHPLPPPFFS